jgi:hypothetical protein
MSEDLRSERLIYVAAPFNHPDPAVVTARMAAFDATIAWLIKDRRAFPISPLLLVPIVERESLPSDWSFWQHYSRRLLGRCDELGVLPLPGYEESEGLRAEVAFAKSLSLAVITLPFNIDAYEDALAQARLP